MVVEDEQLSSRLHRDPFRGQIHVPGWIDPLKPAARLTFQVDFLLNFTGESLNFCTDQLFP